MSTPKFLQRMQQQSPNSPTRTHNRGASMTQSKSPGGIGFLSKQYQAVVQNAGTPTRGSTPTTASSPHASVSPPRRPVASPPGPRPPPPPPTVVLKAMPTSGSASGGTTLDISRFIQENRSVLGARRQDGANEQWCNDYDRLLLETQSILNRQTQQEQQTHRDADTLQQLAKSKQRTQELLRKEEAAAAEIGALKGRVAQLEASLKSTATLLTDEQARAELLRVERNEARKTEIMAMNNAVTKTECEKLANRVAVLESDNAVLLAEKSQWLNQLDSENQQLTELFEDARTAKDVMVRELNAIDEERIKLAEEREIVQQLQQQMLEERQKQEQVTAGGANGSEHVVQLPTHVSSSSAPSSSTSPLLTVNTFTTMGAAKLKFHNLQERLKRRQGKMTTVFDAGSSLIEYYSAMGDEASALSLTSSLLERSLHCDVSLVEDAVLKGKGCVISTITKDLRKLLLTFSNHYDNNFLTTNHNQP